jgi:ankyrin repeat protein
MTRVHTHLLELAPQNINEVIIYLRAFDPPCPSQLLVRAFMSAHRCRPKLRLLFLTLLQDFLIDDLKATFLLESLGNIVRSLDESLDFVDFVFRCSVEGIFSKEQISIAIKDTLITFWDLKHNFRGILYYFDSLLSETRPTLLSELISFHSSWVADNRFRLFGLSRDLLFRAIESDNIDLVQETLFHFQISFDHSILLDQGFPLFLRGTKVNLIEYSAYFGAIRCFRFFLLNNCVLSDRIGMCAIAGGETEILRLLEQHDISFLPSMHIAALYHHFSVLEWICAVNDEGIPLNRLRQTFRNAAISNDVGIGLWLLEEQPFLFEMMSEALESAAENQSIEFCEMLLSRNEICSLPGLAAAVRSGNFDLVSRFLSIPGQAFDASASQELINHATKRGVLNILKLLLRHEKITITKAASSALFFAARHDRCECMIELFDVPVIDVNFVSPEKKTVIHMAIEWGSRSITQILCGHPNININIRNEVSRLFLKAFSFFCYFTPLNLAVSRKEPDFVEILLSHPNIDSTVGDFKGRSPLHRAVRRNYTEIMQLFRERGSTANIRDKAQWTPLHHAVLRKPETLQLLLSFQGIDYNARNKEGETPLHIAALRGCVMTSRILLATPGVNPQLRAVLSKYLGVAFLLVEWNCKTICTHFK